MMKLNKAVKNKWSSALFLTLLVHGIFFIIIFTHVTLRQSHTDPLTQSSTIIGYNAKVATPPLETLSKAKKPIEPASTSPTSDQALFASTKSKQTLSESMTQKPAPSASSTQDSKTNAQLSTSTPVADANVRKNKEAIPVAALSIEEKEVQASSQITDKEQLATLQAEAGLLAADTPQTPADSSQPTIETAAPHKKAKQEAEAINEELRAVIAAVKARNQQQINRVNNTIKASTSTTTDAAQDISAP